MPKYKDSIVQKPFSGCFICGSRPMEIHVHHIMGGANRPKSTEDGLVVLLCPNCHTEGKHAAHRDKDTMQYIRRAGQRAYEAIYGHDAWMKRYKINYLE